LLDAPAAGRRPPPRPGSSRPLASHRGGRCSAKRNDAGGVAGGPVRQAKRMSAEPQPVALDVAIVSYRCRDLLRACLASLDQHAPECPMSVCVVDNASGDGTAAMVAREFSHVTLIESGTNRGFAAATNAAIRRG